MKNAKYTITAPRTPGQQPTTIGTASTLRDARKIAKAAAMPSLTYQDVRIDCGSVLVEFAGPCR